MDATTLSPAPPDLTPRVLRAGEVANLLGRSVKTFYRNRPAYERRGFPLRSELLGGWHRDAVLAWISNHFGLTATVTDPYSIEASKEKLNNVTFKAKRRRARQAALPEGQAQDQ